MKFTKKQGSSVNPVRQTMEYIKMQYPDKKMIKSFLPIWAQSSVIGNVVGAIPGAGMTVAIFMAYDPVSYTHLLVRGNVSLAEFAPEVIGDPLIKSLANRVQVTADPLFTSRYPDRWGCRVRLIDKDGSELAVQVDDMSGSVAKPLTEEQEKRKFEGLAGEGIGAERSRKLEAAILKIETEECIPRI